MRSSMLTLGVGMLVLGLVAPIAAKSDPSWLSEVKLGVLLHDPFRENPGKDDEQNTVDLNGEILFAPLSLGRSESGVIDALLNPRPHLGGLVNTSGYTDQLYGGLTWGYQFPFDLFVEVALGISVHDGVLNKSDPDAAGRPKLGSRVLFREGVDVGYRHDSGHSLAFHISHMSHGGFFAKENDSLDVIGVRYGYHLP